MFGITKIKNMFKGLLEFAWNSTLNCLNSLTFYINKKNCITRWLKFKLAKTTKTGLNFFSPGSAEKSKSDSRFWSKYLWNFSRFRLNLFWRARKWKKKTFRLSFWFLNRKPTYRTSPNNRSPIGFFITHNYLWTLWEIKLLILLLCVRKCAGSAGNNNWRFSC